MSGFLAGAVALLALASVLIVVPLLRRGPGRGAGSSGPPARGAAIAAVVLLAGGGAVLYGTWSAWSWQAQAAGSAGPERTVVQLVQQLEREPDDLQGWIRLGRSYTALEQYPLASRAFQRADRLAGGRNAEAIAGLAEALTLEDDTELTGRAGRLFERALELEPHSGKALFFAAVAAERRGEPALARERFAALLALDPPETLRAALERQIAALDQQIANTAMMPGEATGLAVRVRLVSAPAARAADLAHAPLFVIVRDPKTPGPPLAVKRLANRLPQDVTFTAADAMVPGRGFVAGQTVEVVARISRSGQPAAGSGDPFGQLRYEVGRDGLRELIIDRSVP
ncbi:MAG: hypothetical protein IPI06_05400 [Gammaproteobacteria bacterium]|nr:hypothetical protein [Gammaproteobacteria bacterium]